MMKGNRCCLRLENGRQCRNEAKRQFSIHQDPEANQVGFGWFWVNICEKHFWGLPSFLVVSDDFWRWIR